MGLSEEPRHDPVAGLEHRTGDKSTEPLGPPQFAATQADEEQDTADGMVRFVGSGWQPGESVRLLVQQFPKKRDDRAMTATADASGKIISQYQLDGGNPESQYYLNATGSVSAAQLRFANASANLDQCAKRNASFSYWLYR